MILLTSRNFQKRDLERFGLEVWDKLDILDISKFLNKNEYLKRSKSIKIIEISNLKNLISFFKNRKKSYLIDATDNSFKELFVKFIIKFYQIKVIRYFGGLKPESSSLENNFNFKLTIKRFFLTFINRFVINIVLISGIKHENFKIYLKGRKKIFFTHSFDYNNFLNIKKNKKKKNTIVYLDQNFISHPAFKIDQKRPIADKNFYHKLENYLKIIGKKNKCDIKIALHPSVKIKMSHFNKKNKCYINKTAELIRDSKFVIAHYTTAVAYATLFNKPLTFITSSELSSKRPGYLTKDLSDELGSKLVNIDDQNNFTLNKVINKKKYKMFIKNYVKHPKSKNINTWKFLKNKLF